MKLVETSSLNAEIDEELIEELARGKGVLGQGKKIFNKDALETDDLGFFGSRMIGRLRTHW